MKINAPQLIVGFLSLFILLSNASSQPTLNVIDPPSGQFHDALPVLTINFHDDSGLNRGLYNIGGCLGSWTEMWSYNCGQTDTTINWQIPDLPLGSYIIYFKVINDLGSANSDTCTYYWKFTFGITLDLTASDCMAKCTGSDTVWINAGAEAKDVRAASLKLVYDDQFLTPVEVIKGQGLTPPDDYILYQNLVPDSIFIDLAALTGHFDGPGSLAGIVFQSIRDTISTPIIIDSAIIRDIDNGDIPSRFSGIDLQIDCSLPTVEVAAPSSGEIYQTLPTLTINFHDNVGLDRAYYQIDRCNGPWLPIWSYNSGSPDTSIDWVIPAVPHGMHALYFKVLDDAGNINADSCSQSWNFGYGIPNIYLTPDFYLYKCGDIDTVFISTDELARDIKAASFRIGFDRRYVTPLNMIYGDLYPTSDFIIYYSMYPDSVLIHLAALNGSINGWKRIIGITFRNISEVASTSINIDSCVLRDSNNQDLARDIFGSSMQIDCTPPLIEVISPPSGGSFQAPPTLSIHCQDNNGLSHAYYRIDSCKEPWIQMWRLGATCQDTLFEWVMPALPSGPHAIYFRITDDAGNINSDTCSKAWTMTYNGGCDCRPGDPNNTGPFINLLDITYLINFLYKQGASPTPYSICSGDPNANCSVNLLDITYLINSIYKHGPSPSNCDDWLNKCGGTLRKGSRSK